MAYLNGRKVLQAVKVVDNGGGGGGAELNLAYGLTPPSDTSKIWIRTSATPISVEINDEPTWSNDLTITSIADDLENYSEVEMVRAGEYVYFIGGYDNTNSTTTSKIKRYNTHTGEFEDMNITLPYGLKNHRCVAYKDYIYIFYGATYVVGRYYGQERVIKYNWKLNRIYQGIYGSYRYYDGNSGTYQYYRRYCRFRFNVGRMKDIVVFNSGLCQFPSSSQNYYNTSDIVAPYNTGGYAQYWFYNYNTKTDEFENVSYVSSGGCDKSQPQLIDKNIMMYGGSYSGSPTGNPYMLKLLLGKNEKGNTSINTSSIDFSAIAISMRNVCLTTNKGFYICGGADTPDNTIHYVDYATKTRTQRAETMPISAQWNDLQYNEQTAYGRSGANFVKVENKILLEENKLMIIPDMYNDDNGETFVDVDGIEFKKAIQNIYIGNSSGYAEEVNAYKYEDNRWVGINCDDYTSPTKKNVAVGCQWGETISTSLTWGITCNVGDLIVASVIARDGGNETASAGWTLLGRSTPSTLGDPKQTLAFFYKIATSTYETITITQSNSARIYISLVNFVGKTTATLGDIKRSSPVVRQSLTLPNKLCLVSAGAYYWTTQEPYEKWEYGDSGNHPVKEAMEVWNDKSTQARLGTWIDDTGGLRYITSASADNDIAVGYVEIE